MASLPGVVATLGDTAYEDGTRQQLEECFGGSWGGVKDRIEFAVTGNHDIHTDGGEPLQAYMGSAAVRDGRTWFSDDSGCVACRGPRQQLRVSFGDRCASGRNSCAGSARTWHRAPRRCTIALIHQPRFSSGQHGNDPVVRSLLGRAVRGGRRAGPGRSRPRLRAFRPPGAGRHARTMRAAWCSSSSAPVAPLSRGSRSLGRTPWPGSTTRTASSSSRLRADSWSSRFVDIAGVTRDAGGGSCH